MSRINNEFRLSGRLGGPIEKTFLPTDGRAVGHFSLAIDASHKNRETGEFVERTIWQDLIVYTPSIIERLEKYGGKGREIHVMGTLGKDVWESKTRTNDDGSAAKDKRVTLIVTNLLLGREPAQNQNAEAAQGNTAGDTPYDDDIPY